MTPKRADEIVAKVHKYYNETVPNAAAEALIQATNSFIETNENIVREACQDAVDKMNADEIQIWNDDGGSNESTT